MRSPNPLLFLIALLTLTAGSAACGGETSEGPTPKPAPKPDDSEPRLPPTGLVASSEERRHVSLNWIPPKGAVSISIERDGEEIASLPGDAAQLDDLEATAGKAPAARLVAIESLLEAVRLTWEQPAPGAGQAHEYVAVAVFADGARERSEPATGRRAAPTIGSLDLERDGETIATLPADSLVYTDDEAAAGAAAPAEIESTLSSLEAVELSWSPPRTTPGEEHVYVVVTRLDDGATERSEPGVAGRSAPMVASLRLERDGETIAELPPEASTHRDEGAGAPQVFPPLLAAQEKVDAVHLRWTLPEAAAGPLHDYELVTLLADGSALRAEALRGRRSAPTLRGFRLLRDDAPLADLLPEDDSFADEGAAPGSTGAPTLQASDGTHVDAVHLSWQMPAGSPGPAHSYSLRAVFDEPYESESLPVQGQRSAPVALLFGLSRDGVGLGTWPAGTSTFEDKSAQAATLNAPAFQASQGTLEDRVQLSWEAYEPLLHPHTYELAAVLDNEDILISAPATGVRRAPKLLGYRLQTPGGPVDLGAEATQAFDESAPAGRLRMNGMTATRDHADEVRLEWFLSTPTHGANAEYTLEQLLEGAEHRNFTAYGYRGEPALEGFELLRDGVPIAQPAASTLHFVDTGAAAPAPFQIQNFHATSYPAGISFGWAVHPNTSSSLGTEHHYEIRPRSRHGAAPLVAQASGRRSYAKGTLTLLQDGKPLATPTGSAHSIALPPDEVAWFETPVLQIEERQGEVLLTWGDPVVQGMRTRDYQLALETTGGEVRTQALEAGGSEPVVNRFKVFRNGMAFREVSDPTQRSLLVPSELGTLSVQLQASDGTVDEGVQLDWTIDAQPGPTATFALSILSWHPDPVESPRSPVVQGGSPPPEILGIVLSRDHSPIHQPPHDARSYFDAGAFREATSPMGVRATGGTDARPDAVEVTWSEPWRTNRPHYYGIEVKHSRGSSWHQPVEGSRAPLELEAYAIVREGQLLTELPPSQLGYADTSTAFQSGIVHSLKATGQNDGVQLDWEVFLPIGLMYRYEVEAVYASGERVRSLTSAQGWRERPAVVDFEIERDGGAWQSIGPDPSHLDTEAPDGSLAVDLEVEVDPILSFATLKYANAVWSPPVPSTYRVRAIYDHGPPDVSAEVEAKRLHVAPTRSHQWQRSIDGGPYEDLPGARGALFHDLDAPVDTPLAYRLESSLDGRPLAITEAGATTLPAFEQVDTFGWTTCARSSEGTLVCFGSISSMLTPPEGTFVDLAVGYEHACALRADHSAACWGTNAAGAAESQQGPFVALAAGVFASCGLDAGTGVPVCWGVPLSGTPPGPSSQVSLHRDRACALLQDDSAHCWGARPPHFTGTYQQLALGNEFACALDLQGSVECQGTLDSADVPPGTYLSIHAGEDHACGRLEDGTVRCWGEFSHPPISAFDPPSGLPFLQTSGGDHHACGVREDRKLECWGREIAAAPRRPTP